MKRLLVALLLAGCAPGESKNDTDCEGDGCGECTEGVDCPEVCDDATDNDGDGLSDCDDDDCLSTCDADGDGYIDEAQGGDDCNDALETVFPGALEICDGEDNDCNGLSDMDDPDLDRDSVPAWYRDSDGDGYGNSQSPVYDCEQPPDRVANADDCDDNDNLRNPDAVEICNGGVDDNCDGLRDDDDPMVDLATGTTWYLDADGDMDGDALQSTTACDRPAGYSPLATDCDDSDDLVEGRDLDGDGNSTCDGDCDDRDPALEALDTDGDGVTVCDGDCDDNDFNIGPHLDVDADGADACIDCDDNDPLLNLDDLDADGWTTCDLDCDDNDPLVESADLDGDGVSTCDGDCDDNDEFRDVPGMWVPDADGDGYGDGVPVGPVDCAPPGPNFAPDAYPIDCDDADPLYNPGVTDVCGDGIDHDCDGMDCTLWIEDFESGALDGRWTTWGNADWFVQSGTVYEQSFAAECGNINDSQDSNLETVVDFPAGGDVSFWHTGSTEANYDYLQFFIDGALQFDQAGTWGWTYASFPVSSGQHTLEWRYHKDGSVSTGSDTVWIDDIQMPGATP